MPSWAPTTDDVYVRVPTSGGTFDGDSEPTATQVDSLIAQTVVDVVADVGQFDPTVVINAAQVVEGDDPITLGDVAGAAVAIGTAWQIQRAYHYEQQAGGEDDETRLYRQMVDATERLRSHVASTRPQPTVHRAGSISLTSPMVYPNTV